MNPDDSSLSKFFFVAKNSFLPVGPAGLLLSPQQRCPTKCPGFRTSSRHSWRRQATSTYWEYILYIERDRRGRRRRRLPLPRGGREEGIGGSSVKKKQYGTVSLLGISHQRRAPCAYSRMAPSTVCVSLHNHDHGRLAYCRTVHQFFGD